MDIQDVETAYQNAGEQFGGAEKAFTTAQDNPANQQNEHAVVIENITKSDIVNSTNAFADLVLPKREALAAHKLFSFLALDERDPKHQAILADMLELAITKNGSANNTLYFNVRRKKNSPTDASWFTIMSVAYMHLWSVQTNAMKRTEADFLADGQLPIQLDVNAELLDSIAKTITATFPGVSAELITKSYAPLDMCLQCTATIPLATLFLAARATLRLFEPDAGLALALNNGLRLMARLEGRLWQLHILTGARLQAITKKDA